MTTTILLDDRLRPYLNAFHTYVQQFYAPSDVQIQRNITLKEDHTERVLSNIIALSKSLDLSFDDTFLASIIGLFHDIGRFSQFYTYRTYDDTKTFNHAEHSINVLFQEDFLSSFSDSDKELIFAAILNHNKLEIDPALDSRFLLFSKLIRDADKLDIWTIVLNDFEKNGNTDVALGHTLNTEYNPAILDVIRRGYVVNYNLVTSALDFKLVTLSWIYDIHFRYSFQFINDQQIIQKISHTFPVDSHLETIISDILAYIDSKLV